MKKKKNRPQKTYTVVVEHDGPGGRTNTTNVLTSTSFDEAVKKAKHGLKNPVALSVSEERTEFQHLPFQRPVPTRPEPVRKPRYVDGTQVVIPFGKHKGLTLEDIPCTYLDWLVGEEWFQDKFPDLYSDVGDYLDDPAVKRELERRLARD